MENLIEGVIFLTEEVGKLKIKLKKSESESNQYRDWWLKNREEIKVLEEYIEDLQDKYDINKEKKSNLIMQKSNEINENIK